MIIKRLLKNYCKSYGSALFKIRRLLTRFIEYKIIGCEFCSKKLSNKIEGHQIRKLGNMWICEECYQILNN